MTSSDFRYTVVIRWSERYHAFLAKAPVFPGCIGTGATYQEALESCLEGLHWGAERAEQRRRMPPAAKPSRSQSREASNAGQDSFL